MFVVKMNRWGDTEKHSYILGIYSTKEKALQAGDIEKTWRACKYEAQIVECNLDELEQEKIDYHRNCSVSNACFVPGDML